MKPILSLIALALLTCIAAGLSHRETGLPDDSEKDLRKSIIDYYNNVEKEKAAIINARRTLKGIWKSPAIPEKEFTDYIKSNALFTDKSTFNSMFYSVCRVKYDFSANNINTFDNSYDRIVWYSFCVPDYYSKLHKETTNTDIKLALTPLINVQFLFGDTVSQRKQLADSIKRTEELIAEKLIKRPTVSYEYVRFINKFCDDVAKNGLTNHFKENFKEYLTPGKICVIINLDNIDLFNYIYKCYEKSICCNDVHIFFYCSKPSLAEAFSRYMLQVHGSRSSSINTVVTDRRSLFAYYLINGICIKCDKDGKVLVKMLSSILSD